MGKNTNGPRNPHKTDDADFSLGGRPVGNLKNNGDLTLNDVKDVAKAKANPNLKNLATVAKNPRVRKQAKKMDGSFHHPEETEKNRQALKARMAKAKSSNKPNTQGANNGDKFDLRNGQNGKSFDDPNDWGKPFSDDTLDQDRRNSLPSRDDQDSLSGLGNQNPFGEFDHDKDDHDKDDHDKDDHDKDDHDKDDHDKDKKDKDKKDKDKKDKDKQDKYKQDKDKKSDSENSAAQNAVIVRRKPNDRRKKIGQAGLKRGAQLVGKGGSKLFAVNRVATFYDKYLSPLVNALRNRFANIGMWFKNIGNTLGNWFNGATKALASGLNSMMGLFGLSIAASTASTISSFAIMLMLVLTPLIFVYFYILTTNDAAVSRLINYTKCDVKNATSDDLDDTDGGISSGSSNLTSLAYLKKHNISAKLYKSSWDKTALSISKAVHKITGLKTGLVFAQIYHETGGKFSYAAQTDNNFTGITGTATINEYGASKGSARPAAEGSYYQHFKSINGFVCEYADTLMESHSAPGDKKIHLEQLKKMTTTSQFNDYLKLHGYYAGNKSDYLAGMNAGLKRYNDYLKNGDKDSAKISAVDYESDSDSGNSSTDCKTKTSNNTEASRSAIVKEAKSWIGKFHYSANNRFFQDVKDLSDRSSIPADHTTDCSGFIWFVLTRVGIKVPKFYTGDMESYAKAGKNHLKKIDKEDALPGDIVIMNVGSGEGGNGHTAILTTKWGGSYKNTKVVEMGGYNADKSDDVNTTNIEYAFKSLIDGGARITFARVTGLKKSSGGDDEDNSSKSKVITSLSKKENAARKWIVDHESHGNYKAVNGKYYGAYQLDKSYLTGKKYGDGSLSKKNQDYVAYKYMKERYKTWTKAKAHWVANSWW